MQGGLTHTRDTHDRDMSCRLALVPNRSLAAMSTSSRTLGPSHYGYQKNKLQDKPPPPSHFNIPSPVPGGPSSSGQLSIGRLRAALHKKKGKKVSNRTWGGEKGRMILDERVRAAYCKGPLLSWHIGSPAALFRSFNLRSGTGQVPVPDQRIPKALPRYVSRV